MLLTEGWTTLLTDGWTTPHWSGKYLTTGEKLFLPEDITTPHLSRKRLVGGLRDLADTPYISLSPHIHITLWTTYRPRNAISPPTPTPLTQSLTSLRTTICQSVDYLSAQWLTSPLPTCGLPLYRPVDYLSTNLWTTSPPSGGLPLDPMVDYLSTQHCLSVDMRHDSVDAETHMIQLAHTFGDTDDVLMVVYVLYVTAVVTLRLMIDTYIINYPTRKRRTRSHTPLNPCTNRYVLQVYKCFGATRIGTHLTNMLTISRPRDRSATISRPIC